MQFAQAVAGIFDELVASRTGCSEPPSSVKESLEDLLAMPDSEDTTDLFAWADLGSVYDYLRGGKNL